MSEEKFRDKFCEVFLSKVKEIVPNAAYAWRLEAHKDGFPHYHMFVWSTERDRLINTKYYKYELRKAWRQIIEDNSGAAKKYACKVIPIQSFKKAMQYVSKYTAKVSKDEPETLVGRRWAFSKNLPASPIARVKATQAQALLFHRLIKGMVFKRLHDSDKAHRTANGRAEIFVWGDIEQLLLYLKGVGANTAIEEVEKYLDSLKT